MRKSSGNVIIKTMAAAGGAMAMLVFAAAPGIRNVEWGVKKKMRYAHRGLHGSENDGTVIPENSMKAFERAAEYGFGAELDVHFTKDRKLVVIHDSDLKRMTGREGIVEDIDSAELQEYRLAGTSEKIPYFEDVAALFAGSQLPLVVEIKTQGKNYDELTEAAVSCLDRYDIDYCMESFDPHVLLWLKKNRPEIIRGQLSMDYSGSSATGKALGFLLTNLMFNFLTRPDFIAYEFGARKGAAAFLCCHIFHAREFNWTVHSMRDMLTAESEGHSVIFEGFMPDTPFGGRE